MVLLKEKYLHSNNTYLREVLIKQISILIKLLMITKNIYLEVQQVQHLKINLNLSMKI